MDWLDSLHRIRALKLELARIDPRGGMPITPPPGASEAMIAGVERRLGFSLPPSYRALLAHHDGWPQLFSGASLLGVRALARGNFVDIARMVMDEAEGDDGDAADGAVPGNSSVRGVCWKSSIIPFGIDADAETVFAWDLAAPIRSGELQVILWTNDVGLRLASFPELIDLLLEMLTAELDERRRNAAAAYDLTPRLPVATASHSRVRAVASPLVQKPSPNTRSWAVG